MDKPAENVGLPENKPLKGDPPEQDTPHIHPRVQSTVEAPVCVQPTASRDVWQTRAIVVQTQPPAHPQVAKDIEMKDMGAPVSYSMPDPHEVASTMLSMPSTSTAGASGAAGQSSIVVSVAGLHPTRAADTSTLAVSCAQAGARAASSARSVCPFPATVDTPTENVSILTNQPPERDPPEQDTPQIQSRVQITAEAPVRVQPTASRDVPQTRVLVAQTQPPAHPQAAKEDIEMKDMGASVSLPMCDPREGPSTSTAGPSGATKHPSAEVSLYETAGLYPKSAAGTSSASASSARSGKGAASSARSGKGAASSARSGARAVSSTRSGARAAGDLLRMRNVPGRGQGQSTPLARQLGRQVRISHAAYNFIYISYLGLLLFVIWVLYNLLDEGLFGGRDARRNQGDDPFRNTPYRVWMKRDVPK